MKLGYLTFISLLLHLPIIAQEDIAIASDSLQVRLSKSGSLFTDFFSSSFGEPGFKAHGDEALLYAANLWFMGYDRNGELRGAYDTYGNKDQMHLSGTINTNGAAASTALISVTADQISFHRLNYLEPTYETPDGILNWPGNGDTTIGEMWQMAPFVDVNANDVYEPELGDYPNIIGDACIYLIKNDGATSIGEPLGIEEHYMVSLFNSNPNESAVLSNTMVLNVTLFHRGLEIVDTLHVGLFHDGDLGFPLDDFIASDPTKNSLVFYNSDDYDDVNGSTSKGFGSSPPALAIGSMFCDLWGSMVFPHTGPLDPNLDTITDYYNLLRGKWSDGTCQRRVGDGYAPRSSENSDFTRYVYDGDLRKDTSWTEVNVSNGGGDRQAMLILQPFEFSPGEKRSFTVGYHLARDKANGDNISNAILAFDEVEQVEQALFASYGNHPRILLSQNCKTLEINQNCEATVGIEEQTAFPAFSIFPNPSSGVLQLEIFEPIHELTITNSLGQTVKRMHSSEIEKDIKLAPGLYVVLAIFANGQSRVKKIVVY